MKERIATFCYDRGWTDSTVVRIVLDLADDNEAFCSALAERMSEVAQAEEDFDIDEECDDFTDGEMCGKTVRCSLWGGIAFYIVEDDGDGNLVGVMVGDDKRHSLREEDCTVLDESEYCSECGQIGCTHGAAK